MFRFYVYIDNNVLWDMEVKSVKGSELCEKNFCLKIMWKLLVAIWEPVLEYSMAASDVWETVLSRLIFR